MSYKLNPFTGKLDNTGTEPVIPPIPASIDDLNDVDTSTVPPTDGQALLWDNANSQWEPGTVGGSGSLPTATTDGKALIVENSQWVEGPVIGGYNYTLGSSSSSVYTIPTGFSAWSPEFSTSDANGIPAADVTLSNSNRTATATAVAWKNAISTTTKSSGKWYWEIRPTVTDSQGDEFSGVISSFASMFPGGSGTGGMAFRSGGQATKYQDVGATGNYSSVSGWTANDVLMFAIDLDNKYFWFGVNGTWQNSGDPAAGTGFMYSNWTGTPDFYLAHSLYRTNNSVDLVGYLIPGTTYQAPAIAKRKTSSVTTASLASGTSVNVTLPLTGKAGQFTTITTNVPAWVVFYTDQASRTADASRAQTTDPASGSGVLLEVATSTGNLTQLITPTVNYFNNETTPASELYLKVTNLDPSAQTVTVDATLIPIES